jgi:hypothetical protein
VARLFNAYVMVGWSAASKPATGKDSLWIGVLKPDARFRLQFEAHNPATRQEAADLLAKIVGDLVRLRQRVLLGVDFALGYPEGTAAALKLKRQDWRGLWDFLGSRVFDKPNNLNSRFNDAAQMNRLMTDQPWPFWGAPARDAQRTLTTTKPTYDPAGLPPLLRRTEKALKAAPKPLWQLYGTGAIGGHAILGIPRARVLLDSFGDKAQVWPFQTGWKAPTDLEALSLLIAEVSPAVVEVKPDAGEIPDRARVRELAEHFARLDETGRLAAAFTAPKGTAEADIAAVEQEEGWILGV